MPRRPPLRRVGVGAWIDVAGIPGGRSYGPEIVAGIRGRGAVLLCTEASLASRNVRQEAALAWRFWRPILPLRLEPVEFPDDLLYWVEGAQWIDALDRPQDAWFPPLVRALERGGVLAGPGPGAVGPPDRGAGRRPAGPVDLHPRP